MSTLAICDCDIASEDGIGEKKNRGELDNAICDCDIASKGVKWCDIESEEAKMHRRRVNRIRGEFLLSF